MSLPFFMRLHCEFEVRASLQARREGVIEGSKRRRHCELEERGNLLMLRCRQWVRQGMLTEIAASLRSSQ